MKAIDEKLAETLSDARLVWLGDTAHLPHYEGHPKCLDEISAFVDEAARRH